MSDPYIMLDKAHERIEDLQERLDRCNNEVKALKQEVTDLRRGYSVVPMIGPNT